MKIPPRVGGIFEFLREKVDLAEVVSAFTDLEEHGDTLTGFCPLQEQHSGNPGFRVYPDGFAHCFSCEFHGDITKFWQTYHGMATPYEAAKDLARAYNLTLPDLDPAAAERHRKRREKEESHANTVEANHERLYSERGSKALAYLEGRGFGRDAQKRLLLGATPKGHVSIPYWSGPAIHGVTVRKTDGSTPKYLFCTKEELPLGRKPLLTIEAPKASEYILVEGVLDAPALSVLGYKAIGFGGGVASSEMVEDLLDMGRKGARFVILPDDDERGRGNGIKMAEKLYPYARLAEPLPGEDLKDAADLLARYGAGEDSRGVLDPLLADAADALQIALKSLPEGVRDKVLYLKDRIVPLILQVEAPSERGAIVKDVAKADGLNTEIVRNAIAEVEAETFRFTPTSDDEEEIPESEWAPLLEPGVLGRYVADAMKARGVVGEEDERVVRLGVLAGGSAQLTALPNGKPAGTSMMLTGPSGRGKNVTVDCAVTHFPEEWYLAFEVASSQAFYYAVEQNPAFLKHRFLYPNEAEAVDMVVEFLRPMLSQGQARKFVTNKDTDGKNTFQEIDVEGPITGVIPTTRNKLNDELQTRLLLTELEDFEDRIKQHSSALSALLSPDWSPSEDADVGKKWRAALRSLTGVRRVVAGFDLSEFHFDNKEVSHGARLWGNFIGLMLTHAWLEQRNREIRELRDGTRAVVATAEDYAAVYEIFKATSRRSVVNLSGTHQSIVQAVYDLAQESQFPDDGFSTRAVAEEAGVSKGTVSKNRTFLTKSAGLLYDTEDGRLAISKDAEPSWWTVGDVMAGFPRVADVYAADGKPDPDGPPSGGPSGSKGDTSPGNSGNEGNTETVGKKPDTYAAEPVSEGGNGKETRFPPPPDEQDEHVHGLFTDEMNTQSGVGKQNGNHKRGSVHVSTGFADSGDEQMPVKSEDPLSWELEPGESATLKELKARRTGVLDAEPRVVSYESSEPYDVYVGRGKRGTKLQQSKWHNPFKMDTKDKKRDGTREEVIGKFKRYLEGLVTNYEGKVFDGRHLIEQLPELVGKTLCCHCAPERCHAGVLLSLAEQTAALAPGEEAFLDDEEEL